VASRKKRKSRKAAQAKAPAPAEREKAKRRTKKQKKHQRTQDKARSTAPPAPPPTWHTVAAAAAIVTVALLAYSNSFDGKLVLDDVDSIVENPTIRSLSPPWGPLTTPGGKTTTGRPVTNLSLALNHAAHGTEVRGYHLVNLMIHAAAALLLFGIVRRTLLLPELAARVGGATTATGLGLAVAALWAAHPLNTSCVTYVVQRTESLAGLFYLLTLYLVIRGSQTARPWPFHVGAVLACWLGIGSKEVVLTAPVVILVYDRVFLAGTFKELLRRRWPLYLGLAATWPLLYGLLASVNFKSGMAQTGWDFTRHQYTLTQLEMVTRYLRLALFPSGQVFDYGIYWVKGFSEVWPQAVLIALLLLATLWALRFRPALGFLGVWFFAILSPTSSVIKLINQTAAEYRMYLPLAAVVTLVVLGAHWLLRRVGPRLFGAKRRWIGPVALASAAVVALCLATRARNELFADPVALWNDNAARWPGNPRAHTSLGVLYTERGDHPRALEEFRKAVAINGAMFENVSNLGIGYQKVGQHERAIEVFTRAIGLKPGVPDAYYHRARSHVELKRDAEAIRDYTRALDLKSDHVDALAGRGNAFFRSRIFDRAIADFTAVIALDPAYENALYNRAVCYFHAGQYDRARADIERMRELGREPNPELVRQLASR